MTITYINKGKKITEDFYLCKTSLFYDEYCGEKTYYKFKDTKSYIDLFLIYKNEISFRKCFFSKKNYIIIKDKTGNKSKIIINDIKEIEVTIVYNYENHISLFDAKNSLSTTDFKRYFEEARKGIC